MRRVGLVALLWCRVAHAGPQEWSVDVPPGWVSADGYARSISLSASTEDAREIEEKSVHGWRSDIGGFLLVTWIRAHIATNVPGVVQFDHHLMIGTANLGEVVEDQTLHDDEGGALTADLTIRIKNQLIAHNLRRYIATPTGVHGLVVQCLVPIGNQECDRILASTHFAVAQSTAFAAEATPISYGQLAMIIGGLAAALTAVLVMRRRERAQRSG